MKNSSDTIGNRSRELPVCSAVHQPLRHRVTRLNGTQWRTEGGLGVQPSPRNSEVLTTLSRIPRSVENTSVTT
jgi:hypothetical protein